jgi:hypothetical protein
VRIAVARQLTTASCFRRHSVSHLAADYAADYRRLRSVVVKVTRRRDLIVYVGFDEGPPKGKTDT